MWPTSKEVCAANLSEGLGRSRRRRYLRFHPIWRNLCLPFSENDRNPSFPNKEALVLKQRVVSIRLDENQLIANSGRRCYVISTIYDKKLADYAFQNEWKFMCVYFLR